MDIFDSNTVAYSKAWTKDEAAGVAVLEGGNYAVREIQTEQGKKLELLTQAMDQATGEVTWKPAKNPALDYPERVMEEAQRRQGGIGKNWSLKDEEGILVHRKGNFAAREIPGGKLELLTKQKDPNTKELTWQPAKKPCVDIPAKVYREAGRRQWYRDLVAEGKALPEGYTLGRDPEGRKVGINPEKTFAVRPTPEGKMEILTSQWNGTTKQHEWREARTPFRGAPDQVYSEISRRQFGITKGKEEKAQGRTAQEPPKKETRAAKVQQRRAAGKGKGRGM